VFESASNTKRYESGWQFATMDTYTYTNTQTLFDNTNITNLDQETPYEVKLQFRDRMGNVSAPQPTGLSVEYSNRAAMIGNLADLVAFRAMVNRGDPHTGKEYILTADILNITNWTPIVTDTHPFRGAFNGNGHRISIDSIAEAADMGLFGVVGAGNGEGTVRDLTVQYGGAIVTPTGAFRFGGIAGTAQGSAVFENVQVLGSVTTGGSGSTAYAGGLIGLMAGTARITNAYGGLKLTVNTNPGSSNSLYVGGSAGSMGRPANGDAVKVEGVNVVGDITVGSKDDPVHADGTIDSTVGLFVGGLSGFIWGSGGTAAELLDSNYRQGNIEVWSGNGGAALGGALGRNFGNALVKGCSSLAGSFIIDKKSNGNGFYYAGGFIGDSYQSGTVENCYSDNQIVMSGSSDYTGIVTGGGFAGRIGDAATVSYCYARGDVSATGYNVLRAGGFVGVLARSSASYCYATGDVYVYSKGGSSAEESFAGGFAAFARDFDDCYALGNVFIDKSAGNSNLYVGALVGFFSGYAYPGTSAERCFATGSIVAQRDTAGFIGAGGLAGRLDTYSSNDSIIALKNSVALGASVTLTGSSGSYQSIGRVVANIPHYGVPTKNNYANNSMRLYQDTTYANGRPNEIDITNPANPTGQTPGPNNKHGADAHAGMFHDPTFWQTTLGFSATNWDFSLVALKGHPRLRASPGGPVMGGQ
jgi:hypothetical protein